MAWLSLAYLASLNVTKHSLTVHTYTSVHIHKLITYNNIRVEVLIVYGGGSQTGCRTHYGDVEPLLEEMERNKAGYKQEFADAIVLFISLNFNIDTSSPVIVSD